MLPPDSTYREGQHPDLNLESPVNKKQKPLDLTQSHSYWDSLSVIHLTRSALTEQNHRYAQLLAASAPHDQPKTCASSLFAPHIAHVFSAIAKADLKRFARHGGPDLRDLVQSIEMGSQQSSYQKPTDESSKRASRKTPTSGAYDRNYSQHLMDNRVFDPIHEFPDGTFAEGPQDIDEIRKDLAQRRPSLSPSQFNDSDFENLQRIAIQAKSEKQVCEKVIPILEGSERCRGGGTLFNNLLPLTRVNLADPIPDLYDGAIPEQAHPYVRDALGKVIVPSKSSGYAIVPNFTVEVKGPNGSAMVAERQSRYNGALGARAIHELQSFGQKEPVFDGRVLSFGVTYAGTSVTIYSTHMKPPQRPNLEPSYYHTIVGSFSVINDTDTTRKGITRYRNARDIARKIRNKAIEQANFVAEELSTQRSRLSSDDPIPHNAQYRRGADEPTPETQQSSNDAQKVSTQLKERRHTQSLPATRQWSSRLWQRKKGMTTR